MYIVISEDGEVKVYEELTDMEVGAFVAASFIVIRTEKDAVYELHEDATEYKIIPQPR